jgi:hypothetical protein
MRHFFALRKAAHLLLTIIERCSRQQKHVAEQRNQTPNAPALRHDGVPNLSLDKDEPTEYEFKKWLTRANLNLF